MTQTTIENNGDGSFNVTYHFILKDKILGLYIISSDYEYGLTSEALLATSYPTIEEATEAKMVLCGELNVKPDTIAIIAG